MFSRGELCWMFSRCELCWIFSRGELCWIFSRGALWRSAVNAAFLQDVTAELLDADRFEAAESQVAAA